MPQSQDVTDLVTKVTRPGITKDEMRDIYATWAQNYDQDMSTYKRTTPEELMASVLKYETDKSVTILDLAAGTGTVGQMLADKGFTNMEAYDGSREMLEVAKSRNIFKRIHCQFIGTEPSPGIEEGTYDVVVCCGAFYPGHLDETCLAEIVRMLKKGGRFYFTRMHYEPDPVVAEIEKLNSCSLFERRLVPNINEHGDGYIFIVKKNAP